MSESIKSIELCDPKLWGLPDQAVSQLGEDLYHFWQRFRPCFRTRTRDTSPNAYTYLRGQLTMEDTRNFANIARRVNGSDDDGQGLQQFMSDSPWEGGSVFSQIRGEIKANPSLEHGGVLILDESAYEKAGEGSAGAARQYNGRLGKVELSQVSVCLTYAHPSSGIWCLVEGELFLPEAWFGDDYSERRKQLGIPQEHSFATKGELGLRMIKQVFSEGLPFEFLACDDLYGKNRAFRASLDDLGLKYAAEVPTDTKVYLSPPRVGLPRRRSKRGRKPTNLKVLSRAKPLEIRALAQRRKTAWQRLQVRPSERGVLEADFATLRVWTLTDEMKVRPEWLVIRRDLDGRLTAILLNAPDDMPTEQLIERSCMRFFTERNFEDAKSELGWDDFQGRKYLAWQHHLALTAAASWFVAEVKLNWKNTYPRDPKLLRQFELEVLPALSTANVRELLQAVLPLPRLTPKEAQNLVTNHLVNRARSTSSRLRNQPHPFDSS